MEKDLIDLSEAARLCGQPRGALERWLRKDTGAGRRAHPAMVRRRDARRALERRGLPVPPELEPWPKVVIAEDDPRTAWLEARILRGLWPDLEVREIPDGGRAAAELARYKPDLVILDIDLPGASGLEVCARARAERGLEKTRILALTGKSDPDTNEQAFLAGVDEFMAKPFSVSDLERSARRLMRAGRGG